MSERLPSARALEEFLGVGHAGQTIKFNPKLHPRDRLGKFADVLGRTSSGDKVVLPNGVEVKNEGGVYVTKTPGKFHAQQSSDPAFAAIDALQAAGFEKKNALPVGGDKDFDISVTPFRDKGKAKGEDYRKTTRYKGFVNSLPVEAQAAGVTLHGAAEPTQGVWGGGGEPSTKLRVSGGERAIESFMDSVGQRWDQEGVIAWRRGPDGKGPQRRYVTHGKVTPAAAKKAITAANAGKTWKDPDYISGATIRPDGKMELIDLVKSDKSTAAMIGLLAALRQEFDYDGGYGKLRLEGRDYPRRRKRAAQEAPWRPSDEARGLPIGGADRGHLRGLDQRRRRHRLGP